LGDTAAWKIVSRCLQLVMDEVERFDGEVIKTIGDEVMCKFPTAEQAVLATKAMQERLLADGDVIGAGNDSAVKMRIGFNYGAVLKQGKGVIGDAVNVAARMASSANPGQILTTAETIQLLPATAVKMTRSLGRIPVKGKAEYIDAYEVVWGEESDYTEVVSKIVRTDAFSAPNLRIVYANKTIVWTMRTANSRSGVQRRPACRSLTPPGYQDFAHARDN
jgi:adenylate cyclase